MKSEGKELGESLAPVVAMPPKPEGNAERRRFPRHALRGAATIQSRQDMPATSVVITDVSVGGCYLETYALCPIGTRVLVKFDFCDLRIAEFGIVTTCHPMVGMGIQFEAVSPQLQQLIELLANGGQKPCPAPISAVGGPQDNPQPLPVVAPVLLTGQQTHELARALVVWFEAHAELERSKFFELLQSVIAGSQSPR